MLICKEADSKISQAKDCRVFYNSKNGYWYLDFYKDRKIVAVHRFLLDAPKGSYVDHINGLKGDNRLSNLRFCNKADNSYNRPKRRNSKTLYKGVTKTSGHNSYTASAGKVYIGNFKTQEEAARAYDRYVLKHHREFAFTNFPVDDYKEER